MKTKLQIALDDLTMEKALRLLDKVKELPDVRRDRAGTDGADTGNIGKHV